MKKIIIGLMIVILLAVIVFGIVPWYEGVYFQREYMKIIANINQESQLKITVQQYQRGWYQSHVVLNITPVERKESTPQPANLLGDQFADYGAITLDQQIVHGPLVCHEISNEYYWFATATIQNLIYLSPKLQTFLFGNNKQQAAAQINTVVRYNGDWINEIFTPTFTAPIKDMGKITWKGLKGTTYFKIVSNRVVSSQSNLTIGEVIAESTPNSPTPNLQITLQPVLLSSEATRKENDLWDEITSISSPSFLIKDGTGIKFALENMNIKNTTSVNNDMYNASFNLSIQKLLVPTFVIPQFTDAALNVGVNNLSSKEISALVDYARSEQAKNDNSTVFFNQYNKQLLRLITPSTFISVAKSFNTTLGGFLLNAKINWPDNTPLPQTIEDVSQHVVMKTDIKVAAELARKVAELSASYFMSEQTSESKQALANTTTGQQTQQPSDQQIQAQPAAQASQPQPSQQQQAIPSTVAMPTENMMDTWLKQGYITQQGSDYITTITYENGMLKVNGKPISQQPETTS